MQDAILAFERLKRIGTKGELGETLALAALQYSIYDLQYVSDGLHSEVNRLPSPYRENIAPYFTEQFFGRYYRLIRLYNEGAFKRMSGDIKDKGLYCDYCEAVEKTMSDPERTAYLSEHDTHHGVFYFVVNCFSMFVEEEPGHPVGMPFPGGLKVEKKDGAYYCPIREKEKDIPYSICNFCPCKQADI